MGSKKYSALVVTILLMLVVVACSQRNEPQETKRPINPNGDSELALLMRDMFEESDSLKKRIMGGQSLSGLKKYEEIHSAIPTDPKVIGPVFKSFASAYIESIRKLESSDSSTVFNFNRMVDRCMSCHTEFCQGPKKRIKQLYISE